MEQIFIVSVNLECSSVLIYGLFVVISFEMDFHPELIRRVSKTLYSKHKTHQNRFNHDHSKQYTKFEIKLLQCELDRLQSTQFISDLHLKFRYKIRHLEIFGAISQVIHISI